MRKTELAIGEYYHIYNRGVDKRTVFECDDDYLRFLTSAKEFNTTNQIGSLYHLENKRKNPEASGASIWRHPMPPEGRLVTIICYCLNPNHFHFMLKQETENGISKFMHKLGMGYTNYFNEKNDRSGSLFQGKYKAIHIDTNEYLLLLSAYINMNHTIHGYPEKDWPYSSLLDYTGKRDGGLCSREIVDGEFNGNFDQCKKYLDDNALYFREKKEMEKYILE